MKTRYSPSTKAFYPFTVEYGDGLPADVVEISEEDYGKALEARSEGSVVSFEDGELVISSPEAKQLTIDEARAAALNAVNARCAKELASVRAGYPDDEVQSWAKQEAEARAYLANPSAQTPLLSALCAARGMDMAELAPKVVAKADAFAVATGTIIGTRQACEDEIYAAKTAEEASAVVWPL